MKFSQVFVVLSAFLAMSLAAPSNWGEDEELVPRNEKAVEEKRALLTLGMIAAKKLALNLALTAACNLVSSNEKLKGLCDCVSIPFGDEEFIDDKVEHKRWLSSAITELTGLYKTVCNSVLKYALRKPCNCLKTFLH